MEFNWKGSIGRLSGPRCRDHMIYPVEIGGDLSALRAAERRFTWGQASEISGISDSTRGLTLEHRGVTIDGFRQMDLLKKDARKQASFAAESSPKTSSQTSPQRTPKRLRIALCAPVKSLKTSVRKRQETGC